VKIETSMGELSRTKLEIEKCIWVKFMLKSFISMNDELDICGLIRFLKNMGQLCT